MSYWLIEQPGLALRDWLIGRTSAGTGAPFLRWLHGRPIPAAQFENQE
jgi:hypothetical protein